MKPGFNERGYHVALYLTGALVLSAAVAITGVRLALPNISQHKGTVEAWAGSYMEQTIRVDSISAEWQGWIPSLLLRGVELRSLDGAQEIFSFDAVTVEISPLMSLLKWQLVPRHVVISGLEVSAARLDDGTLLVEGLHIDPADGERDNRLAKWLFGQDSIAVRQTAVTWTDHKHRQDAIRFTDISLFIRNKGARSQIAGELSLPGRYGEKMSFALDTTGELWSSDWSGEIYAAATQLNPDSWYREYRPERVTPAGGNADLELWSSWEQAKPVRLQGRLAYRDFALLTNAESLNVGALAGQFLGQRLPDRNWHFLLELDRVETENGVWPAANVEFVVPTEAGQRYALSFDYLNLVDLAPLAPDLEQLPAAARRLLDTGSVRSELLDGLIIYDQRPETEATLVYDVALRNLDASLGPDRPAVTIRSGRLRGTDSRGSLAMNGASGKFSIPELYSNELLFSRLDGSLSWARTPQGWKLQTQGLSLENRDMSLAVRGTLENDGARPTPYLDLVAEIRSKRLEKMFNYMPSTPKFRIREWMERSLHAGHVESAIAVLRGYPDEFPFRDNNGNLQGVVNLSQGIVEYSPNWPGVDNVDAEIFFDNEMMTAHISRGSVFGAEVTAATGIIEDLTRRPKVVLLEGRVKGLEQDLEAFIAQSPLAEDRIIKHANESLVAGNFRMDLDMSIPIKAPHLQSVIDGTLDLEAARLVSDSGNLALEQVNGTIGFTRESVDGRDLTAVFAGEPVSLSMSGSKNHPATPPAFVISGNSTDAVIIKQLSERFPGTAPFAARLAERISGSADWQVRFIFEQDAAGLSQRLELASDLYGLTLDLPKPLWKPTYARRPLTIRKTLLESTPIELDYAPGIYARLHLGADQRLEKLAVSLGGGHRPGAATDDAGLTLSGHTDKLLFDEWRDAIAFFTPEPEPAGAGHVPGAEAGFFSSADIDIRLDTGLLEVFEQSFTDSRLAARREQGDWTVNLQGESLAGDIILPRTPTPENRVQLNLDKLVISKADDARGTGKADPKTLPPIRAAIADLTYGDYQLGSMSLTATPTAHGMSFEEIGFTSPQMTINGTGLWEKPFNQDKSNFNIDLEARKLHRMLAAFGYDDAAIKAGKTAISIDAGWDGAPDEFSLEKLAGTFDIRVKKGRLLEVSPAAGRLFGLLSIQSLPRRLTLDFTDLFGKGLAFDRITGSFNIANGNAYTNGLHLAGPSVDVLISGRTGLIEQDYDQLVTVTPQFADNLPIASALLGPVGIGVGAVLYLAGNMFETINDNIDKMLRHQYTISGNWYNPKIEKLKEPVEDQQVQAADPGQPAYPQTPTLDQDSGLTWQAGKSSSGYPGESTPR